MDTGVEVLFKAPGDVENDLRHDIFLVHGFLGAKFSYYRDILEHWVSALAKKSTPPVTARVFRFDGSAIPIEGKDALEREVWKLRRFLVLLLDEIAHRKSVDQGMPDSDGGDNLSFQRATSSTDTLQQNRNTIQFIAHGLGSWVVKDVLAHPSSGNIAYTYGRTEVKFVDLDIDSRVEDTTYQHYLTRNWTAFNISLPKPQLGPDIEDLISYLREIDDNFSTFASIYSATDENNNDASTGRTTQTIYKGQDMVIWMSNNRFLDSREPAWIDRFSRLLLGKHASVAQAQFISKLPSRLEVPQYLDPQSMIIGNAEASGPLEAATAFTSEHWAAPTPTTPWDETYLLDRHRPASPTVTTDQNRARDASGYFPQIVTDTGPPLHQPKDDDILSVVSTPKKEFIRMSSEHVWSAYNLANSFLQRGELENAGVLLRKILVHTRSDAQSLERIEICMQIAAVKMYRGHYEDSRKDLLEIERQLRAVRASGYNDISTTNETLYHCQRWLASCRLLAGQWKEAVSEMQSLLNNEPERYHVRLHRDLSLAYAYLGLYGEARASLNLALERARTAKKTGAVGRGAVNNALLAEQSALEIGGNETPNKSIPPDSKQRRLERKQGQELRAKERSVQVAKATIDLLAGDYPAALTASSQALDFMKVTIGSKHFKTLAAATLKAWCLAHNGRYIEAETLCSSTYKATTQALGHRHPQTLEAMECLVYIFRCQGRFAEAIGTGVSLNSLSEQGMKDTGINHPQPIHAKFQLAKSYFANGDYMTSKLTFNKVVADAEAAMGKKHPSTLMYKSEQARVSLYLGDISEARSLAILAVAQQFELYTKDHTSEIDIAQSCRDLETGPREEHLSQVSKLLDLVLKEAGSRTGLHPFVLSTLQLIANIEVRQFQLAGPKGSHADLTTARKILTTLQNFPSNLVPQGVVLASSINLDLATLHKEESTNPNDLNKAIELFSQAYQSRKSLMGSNHLDTLCAQRDLTIAQCLQNLSGLGPDDFTLAGVKKVLDSIRQTMESRLGLLHPETMTSQLWCFTVDLLLQEDSHNLGNKSWEDLIKNFSEPGVVKERLIESLVMKRQLASLLHGTGKSQEALLLVESCISEMKEAGEAENNERLRETLSDLIKTFLELAEDCVATAGHSFV